MPVIHLEPAGISPDMENFADLFRIYGQRMAEQASSFNFLHVTKKKCIAHNDTLLFYFYIFYIFTKKEQ